MSGLITALVIAATGSFGCKQPDNHPRLFEPRELDSEVGGQLRRQVPNVVFLAPKDVVDSSGGRATLKWSGNTGLCPDQRFAKQNTVSMGCSGVLVKKGLVLTAAHCIDRPVADFVVVFGYDDDPKTQIRAVGIRGIRHCIPNNERGDLVSLELDEPIEPTEPARIGPPVRNSRVHMLGHPMGLSLKVSTCAVDGMYCAAVPKATQIGVDWFLADVDGYGGSSGSPVYSGDGKTLIGIWSSAPTVLESKSQDGCETYPIRPKTVWGGKATRVDRVELRLTRNVVTPSCPM